MVGLCVALRHAHAGALVHGSGLGRQRRLVVHRGMVVPDFVDPAGVFLSCRGDGLRRAKTSHPFAASRNPLLFRGRERGLFVRLLRVRVRDSAGGLA